MKVRIPMTGSVSEVRINSEILPVGFVAKEVNPKKFHVLRSTGGLLSGYCEIEDGYVVVNFYTVTDWAKEFMKAFGTFHPEFNPLQVLHCFVYKSEGDDFYQMAMLPLKSLQETLPALKASVAKGNLYYVKFHRGDWRDDSLYVLDMRDIAIDGSLGENVGPKRLALGSAEKK